MFVVSIFAKSPDKGSDVKLVVERYIHDGNQTYSFSVQGIKNPYEMLSLQKDKIELYNALKPTVDKILEKQKTQETLSIVFGSIGGGTAVASGILFGIQEGQNASNREENKAGPDHSTYQFPAAGLAMITAGTLFGIFGAIIPVAAASPTEEDFFQYINRYNL